jgi:hypothetical protein
MIEAFMKAQIGVETTMGTEVDATTLLRAQMTLTGENTREFGAEDIGILGGLGRSYVVKRDASASIDDMTATFEQLPHFLNAGIDGVTPVQDAAGGYEYTWVVPYDATTYAALDGLDFLTLEMGDEQQAKILTGTFAETLTITMDSEGAWKLDGTTLRGQPRENTTFTAAISVPSVEEILFGNTALYINDTGSAFGTTQIDNFLGATLTISNLYTAVWTGTGDGAYFGLVKLTGGEATLTWRGEHDADAVTEDGKREDGTARAVQLIATGSAISGGSTYTNKTAIINCCGTYSAPMTYSRENGNVQNEHTLRLHYNADRSTMATIIVVNELSALP